MNTVAEIFGKRLTQARSMAQLSLRELSDKLGEEPSHTMLSRYEKGLGIPDGAVVARLCEVLDRSPDFFFREFEVEFSEMSFRKRARLSAKERKSIQEKSRDFFSRYFEIEEILDCRNRYKEPFPSECLEKVEDVEGFAERLRNESHWNLGQYPVPNLHQLMELKGIKVHEVETEDEAFDGFSGKANGEPIVVLAKWLDRKLPRKRMTAAHELGHIVLPIPNDLPEKAHEELVKPFAGAFLLPQSTFTEAFGGHRSSVSLGELIELKIYFGVSIMGIMMRANSLNLIPNAVAKRFWIMVNKRGWRKYGEPGDELFEGKESHSRLRQLVLHAVAEGIISSGKGATMLNKSVEEFRILFREAIV